MAKEKQKVDPNGQTQDGHWIRFFIPKALHGRIKIQAIRESTTMPQYITKVLEKVTP